MTAARFGRGRRLLALGLLVASAVAAAQGVSPPPIAAPRYVLVDASAHQVLAERGADTAVDPGSLAKLMEAYLVFVALRDHQLTAQQALPISARAAAERKGGGPLMFVDAGGTASVDELLQGLVVDSGNDAAVALAEGLGGSVAGCVAMMNRQAQAWGLQGTRFANVSGRPEPGQRSTARDLATIAAHLVHDFPDPYRRFGQRSFTYRGVRQDNPNLLLDRDSSVDGLKSAHSEAGGYDLVASAQRSFASGPRRLIAVVLGADSVQGRADQAQRLLNWGFTAFDAVRLAAAGHPVLTLPVWKGAQAEVGIGSAEPIVVAVPRGEGDQLRTRVEHTDPLVAPLLQGQRVGTLRVSTRAGAPVAAVPLTVLVSVPQAGILGRAWDAIRLWIK